MKKFLILSGSVLLLLIPVKLANGCGYYLDESQYRVYLLQPDVLDAKELRAFFYTPDYFHDYSYNATNEPAIEINCREWQEHCKYKGSWKDIYEAMYGTGAAEFLSKQAFYQQSNPFIKHLFANYKKEYTYFVYTRRCELTVNVPDPWDLEETDQANTKTLYSCLDEAEKLYKEADNDFLKMRTAYQIIKFKYYYPTEGESAKEVFEKCIEPLQTDSWIKESARFYCIESTSNAALYNYRLSLSFDKSIDKRFRCVQLFSRKQLSKTLAYAENDHQKAAILTMYELQNPGRSLSNLKRIFIYDRRNKDLPLLVSRELNKVEDWLLTPELTGEAPSVAFSDTRTIALMNRTSDLFYLQSLYSFIHEALSYRKTSDPALWQLLAAHASLLMKRQDKAQMHLDFAAKESKDPKLLLQVKYDQLLSHFDGKTKLDPQLEAAILSFEAYSKKHPDLFFMQEQMSEQLHLFIGKRLIQAGDIAKGIFFINKTSMSPGMISYWTMKTPYIVMLENAKPADYDEAIGILNGKQKTDFEKFLTAPLMPHKALYENAYYYDPGTDSLNASKLQDYKSMYYVQHNQLDSALACVSKIPSSYWDQAPYNLFKCFPFAVSYGLDHQGNNDFYVYDKRMYLQRMCDLQTLIDRKEGDVARHHFVLATGYFNMSYHGNYWIMNMPYKLSDEVSDAWYKLNTNNAVFTDNYYGCKQAEYHYLQAMKLTKDSAFALLCAARASACNVNYQEINWRKKARLIEETYDWDREFNPVYGVHKKDYERLFGKSSDYDDYVSNCYHYEHLDKRYY